MAELGAEAVGEAAEGVFAALNGANDVRIDATR